MSRALITGGTSGIGHEFARQLAQRSYDLVLVARDKERLDVVAEELRTGYGVEVEVLPADLADRDQLQQVALRLGEADRRVDLLVNNAGFGVHSRLLDSDLTAQDAAIDVMVRAVMVLSNAAGRAMRDRHPNRTDQVGIINVSSTAGYVTMGAYSAIKAWVTAYTEALAGELAGSGVRVTALCPGWVRTEFHQRAGINASAIPTPLWLEADRLVRDALVDFDHGKVISIPSKRYKVLIGLARVAPRRLIRSASSMMSSSRHSR
ncbi:SDR family oxidoreductase [Microlunatus sp. Gsoil 973]|uniref:SDR family NAD(P)-dependent oxidoreductase n=1 Tax=Microlunatus sp. Gsoil 973 TaxID=2672569 RepID=UPI0012B449C9|nr:SDR family oxidoreductase [Microlunatus sp. Gsoil 973]QGN34225.1 SDR family NAD(P)-dependent oxidoreductase [Microlunatus sp. Gsoil 973]